MEGSIDPVSYLRSVSADAAADTAAELLISHLEGSEAETWAAITFKVALRLAILEAEVWDRTPQLEWVRIDHRASSLKDAEQFALELRRGIESQGHELRTKGHFVHCTRCRRWKSQANISKFASLPCMGTNINCGRAKARR